MATLASSQINAASTAPSRAADDNQTPAIVIRLFAVMFFVMIFALTYLVMAFWPGAPGNDTVTLFGGKIPGITPEVRLMWLVVFASSLGSGVHAVTSFASFVGNRTFQKSWLAWYALRTPIGVALAMVFYFVLRGGFFTGSGTNISPFGVAALSGMVGMFSKQATDKLAEVFDNLFKTDKGKDDDAREDPLNPKEGKSRAANV